MGFAPAPLECSMAGAARRRRPAGSGAASREEAKAALARAAGFDGTLPKPGVGFVGIPLAGAGRAEIMGSLLFRMRICRMIPRRPSAGGDSKDS